MKKIFVLFTFLSLATFAMNAQECSHAKKSQTAAATEVSSEYAKLVAEAAASDATIETKVCEKSGNVSYTRKNVCEKSGKVSYADVTFDAATKKFVNVSPSDAAAGEKAATGKKAGCCSTSCSKACCAGKTKSSSASSAAPASEGAAGKVKMVKSED